MLISLYRLSAGDSRDCRVILDRNGSVVERTTTVGPGHHETRSVEVVIGPSSYEGTDRLMRDSLREAQQRGYAVLYGYIPAPSFPLTRRHILETTGIDVEPNPIDGLPVWPPRGRPRGSSPTYLLFTVLSSVVK